MSRKISNLLLIGLLAACSQPSFAQKLEDDLNKIVQHVDTARTVSLQSEILVYGRKGGSKIYTAKASLKRSGQASLTVLDEIEYFSDGSYFVTVDHEEHKVSVVKNDEQRNKEHLKGMNLDLKALQKLMQEEKGAPKPVVKLVSDADGMHTYSITKIPSIDEVRITLNTKRSAIASISYEYSDESEYKGQYIVINYTGFECNTDVSASLKQSQFFTLSDGKVNLSNRLKTYTLYSEL